MQAVLSGSSSGRATAAAGPRDGRIRHLGSKPATLRAFVCLDGVSRAPGSSQRWLVAGGQRRRAKHAPQQKSDWHAPGVLEKRDGALETTDEMGRKLLPGI